MTLSKKSGEETVTVIFHVQDEEEVIPEDIQEDANYEDVEMDVAIKFRVDVEKAGNVVRFDCQAVGENVEILNVTGVIPNNLTPAAEDKLYSGPAFSELDEDLQKGFGTFLEKKGIDSDMAYFIVSHARVREQELYVSWLTNLKSFVSKK